MADTGMKAIDYVAKTSRYRLNTVHKDNDDRFYFSLPKPVKMPMHKDDSFFGVDIKHKHRMDRITHRFFNNAKLWWLVAMANDLENGLFLENEVILRIPAMHIIYGHGGILSNR